MPILAVSEPYRNCGLNLRRKCVIASREAFKYLGESIEMFNIFTRLRRQVLRLLLIWMKSWLKIVILEIMVSLVIFILFIYFHSRKCPSMKLHFNYWNHKFIAHKQAELFFFQFHIFMFFHPLIHIQFSHQIFMVYIHVHHYKSNQLP